LAEVLPITVESLSQEAADEQFGSSPGGILDDEVIAALNERLPDVQEEREESLGNAESSGSSFYSRQPFIFTRVGEQEAGIFVYAALNPTEISYTIPTREALEKCGGGEVKHTAQASLERAESLGKFIDEIEIRYTLTTGNALPLRFTDGGLGIPDGLDTFYALMALLLESERVLEDGRSNDLIISQNSVTFPMITVEGKLKPEGVSFVQSADDPNKISGISFSVSVHKTVPRLTSVEALRAAWENSADRIGSS